MPNRRSSAPHGRLNRLASAITPALWLLCTSPLAAAGVTLSGSYWLNPGPLVPLGPADIDLSDQTLWVGGRAGDGSFAAMAGAHIRLRSLFMGAGQSTATGLLDGAGTQLTLVADGHSSMLELGNYGNATLTVSNGAVLDARSQTSACGAAGTYCGSVVSNSAGSTARLTLTGAGSSASFAGLTVGNGGVDRRYDFGTPGGVSQGRVEVLAGATLRSDQGTVGTVYPGGVGSNGFEQGSGDVVIDGAGSTWLIQGSSNDANLNLASGARSTASLTVSRGGLLKVQASAGRNAGVDLTSGGHSSSTITGAGSRFEINGDMSRLVVGNSRGGTALLTVSDGAVLAQAGSSGSYLNIGEGSANGRVEILSGGQVSGARSVNVGSGGTGSLLISGAGSLLTTDRTGSFVGQINVGQQGAGSLDVLNGGAASAFSLQVGNGYDRTNRGRVVIDGVGTQVALDAVDWHRMSINSGSVLVSGGALLDGTVNAAACNGHWCGVFLANNAGDDALFTVTGSGSKARFLSNFNVGQGYVTAPPSTAWTLGEPGATSLVQVNVLAGARLETQAVNIANGSLGPAATGSEGVIAQLRIKGPGSIWSVTGGGTVLSASFVSGVAHATNTLTDIQITDGGQLQLAADPSWAAFVQLGANGGVNRMSISGAGSKLVYGTTNNAGLWIGRNGATASLSVGNGGAIEGVNRLQVGNSGAVGNFAVSGPTSSVTYGSRFADLFIGRSGVGVADISAGAQVQMHADNIARLTVGDNGGGGTAAGNGSLTLRGASTLLSMKSGVADNAATANPIGTIGWGSNGVLAIRDGATLRVEGLAPADPALYYQGAGLTIGNGWDAAASGRVEVSGAGSKIETLGTNPYITVGTGAHGSGQLSITNGAVVRTTLMGIADFGASGSTQIDNATLQLEGAWRSGCCIGASLAVGSGAGSAATLTLNHGGQLLIDNSSGSERTNLSLGGIRDFNPGGSGIMSLSGGARVSVTGSGGGGGQILVGATADGIGIVNIADGSQMNANYIGVGAFDGADAGVGTLVVKDSSTVTADHIEVGAKGYVGGTGTLIGDIVNRGVFSPGSSPGTLHVSGSFTNQAGGKLLLEVESDGHGGFVTDHLVFDAGSAVSLGSVQIEFRFLGATDPNAFQASGGFQIDSFLRQGRTGLDHGLLSTASYSASSGAYEITGFSFSADGGAVFHAQAVPEPGTWMLFVLGLGLGGWLQRRRAPI